MKSPFTLKVNEVISCLCLANEGCRLSQAIGLWAVRLTTCFLSKRLEQFVFCGGKSRNGRKRGRMREFERRCDIQLPQEVETMFLVVSALPQAQLSLWSNLLMNLLGRSWAYSLMDWWCGIKLAVSLLLGILNCWGIFYTGFFFFIWIRIFLHQEIRLSKGKG